MNLTKYKQVHFLFEGYDISPRDLGQGAMHYYQMRHVFGWDMLYVDNTEITEHDINKYIEIQLGISLIDFADKEQGVVA